MVVTGMLRLDELAKLADAGAVDTVVAGFTDQYGRLCGKRFDAGFFIDTVVPDGTHACDYLLTADMEMEPVAGYRFASWDLGYGDVHLVPDMATLRVASWLDRTALVLCDVHDQRTHAPAAIAPRTVLRAQVERGADRGLVVKAATELEHYLFNTSYRDAALNGYTDVEPAGWYLEDYQLLQGTRTEPYHAAVRRFLNRSGVPVESSKGEWGLGQHEINVRFTDVLAMADRHVVFKQCLKEVADQQGMSVTFMAKPFGDRAGSSCHTHLSLWRDDVNAFAGGVELGPARGSDELRWFVGDLYAATDVARVPRTLRDATDLFAASAFAKEAFGEDVVEHYTHFFRTEQAAFDAAAQPALDGDVTDWERRRYFERI
ncbi:MAG TPA: glutamine synthetase family protein [Acidimicrobiia bacterium]|nr:glutamine synthetase family protein [Acidimicrobiia bacterium]